MAFMGIEFIDLKTQYRLLKNQIDSRIHQVLDHGKYIMGPEIGELEEKLAAFVDTNYCITVSDGTTALLIALMALDIGPGDEVITTPFTFISTSEVIALLGAKPVYVDINPLSYNIEPSALEAAVTKRTKAIMPVSLYGQCADFDEINRIAGKYGLPVIEDGAQSFGATYKGRRSCSLTTIGCTSFFPSKPLGCYGDGGACFTDDPALAERMRRIRLHGQERRYYHSVLGLNGRLDTIQAAILLAKLTAYPDEMVARERIGQRYSDLLEQRIISSPSLEDYSDLKLPHIGDDMVSVYAQYTLQVGGRDNLVENLAHAGIPTAIHYPHPLHLQPAFEYLGLSKGSYPIAEVVAERVISLPMHPYLDPVQQDRIVDELVKAVEQSFLPLAQTGY